MRFHITAISLLVLSTAITACGKLAPQNSETAESFSSANGPAPSPTPTPAPATTRPDATNTGWQPTGVTLKPSGSIDVTVDGTIIDGLDVSGGITINANNVTIRRTRVSTTFWYPIWVKGGSGVVIEDSEVDGLGGPADGGQKCLYITSGAVTVQRNNFHDCEDGMSLGGNGPLLVHNNWIHNPNGPSTQHSDGMEYYGGANATIQYNNFDYANATTSATNFTNDFGPITNIVYDHNWLRGGAYNLYVDGSHNGGLISNVKVTNNIFYRNSSAYGTTVIRGNISSVTVSGNTFEDGTPIN